MCGRAYETFTEEELWLRYQSHKLKRNPFAIEQPIYNLAPTQTSPVLFIRNGEAVIEPLRWGLIPSWAKNLKSASKYSLINAMGEEIDRKPSYKDAFRLRRCVVPLSGFFEWKRDQGSKRPFVIRLKDKTIMSLAGVREHWVSADTGEVVDSFSIITTGSNGLIAHIHNRMPVILDPEDEAEWLDPNNKNLEKLKSLLKPCPAEWLETYEVSPFVNSAKNDTEDTLKPLQASEA